MTADDEWGEWMRRAQAGDADAYAGLLRAITSHVRLAVRRNRGFAGPEAVEDLVQDVLLSVHAARATYEPGRPFRPWLAAIIRHRLADGARRYARHESREVPLEEPGVTLDHRAANNPAEAPEDLLALRDAIESLPSRQREAVELLKLRGLSLEEAARETGSTAGALKVACHRGIAAVRRLLTRTSAHEH